MYGLRANPLAPVWAMPGTHKAPEGYEDQYQEYSLLYSLTALQVSRDNAINFDQAGCFIWLLTGSQVGVPVTNNSPYVWVRDHLGRYMQDQPVQLRSWAQPGELSAPLPVPQIIPGGSQMLFDLYEVNNTSISGNIVLRGFTRRRING
jgi:hypothetical protein